MLKDYIIYNGRDIEEVKCKVCGTSIRGLVVDASKTQTEKQGNKVFIYQRMKLVSFANYAELKFEFTTPQGFLGTHVTSICQSCLSSLPKDIELELMAIDIQNLESRGAKLSFTYSDIQKFKVLRRL